MPNQSVDWRGQAQRAGAEVTAQLGGDVVDVGLGQVLVSRVPGR
jgi:hypothetical protein